MRQGDRLIDRPINLERKEILLRYGRIGSSCFEGVARKDNKEKSPVKETKLLIRCILSVQDATKFTPHASLSARPGGLFSRREKGEVIYSGFT